MQWHQKKRNQFEMEDISNIFLCLQFQNVVHDNSINFLHLYSRIIIHIAFIVVTDDHRLIENLEGEVITEQ
jgi:hypothetical protein